MKCLSILHIYNLIRIVDDTEPCPLKFLPMTVAIAATASNSSATATAIVYGTAATDPATIVTQTLNPEYVA